MFSICTSDTKKGAPLTASPDIAKHKATNKLAVAIALGGGRVAPGQFFANWQWYCDEPVELKRRVTSRDKENARKGSRLNKLVPMELAAMVPCRKCSKCLQYRQMKWRARALTEVTRAKRTWFVTLTFSPSHLAGILMTAKDKSDREVERVAYAHVQKFYKRLRKAGHRFRYLSVFERGDKHGRGHYHLLLHEVDKPITKRQIESKWRRYSFTGCRLVGADDADRDASYITKYSTKSFEIRPRASQDYGKTVPPPPFRGGKPFF